jgi:hypothetical protein
MRFHPPASSPPSPEFYGLRAAPRAWLNLATQPTGRRAPPMGSSSLIAASASGVHHSEGNPDPAVTFRPRRFTRPRRFPPPPAFAGLFHPAATSRVCPSGVCPSLRSRTGFPRPIHALLPLSAIACDQRPRPRLQGFAPRCECGVGRNGLGPDRSAPLLGFSSSGCSLRATWECLHIPSAPDLSPRRTPRGRPSAFCRCTDWLAWIQAADPLELSGLNPRPPFESRVRGPFQATHPSRRTRRTIEHALCQLLNIVSPRKDWKTRSGPRARSGHLSVRRLGIFGGRL